MSLHEFGIYLKGNHRNLSQESLKSINIVLTWLSCISESLFDLADDLHQYEKSIRTLLTRAFHLIFRISLTHFCSCQISFNLITFVNLIWSLNDYLHLLFFRLGAHRDTHVLLKLCQSCLYRCYSSVVAWCLPAKVRKGRKNHQISYLSPIFLCFFLFRVCTVIDIVSMK